MYKLSNALTTIYNYYLPTCFAKGIELNLDLKDVSLTTSSPSAIKKIVKPLIDDAISRTGKKGSITIGASRTKSGLEITISDTGESLSRAEQADLMAKNDNFDVTSRLGYGTTITIDIK